MDRIDPRARGLVRLLARRKHTLAVAESCTGGALGAAVTAIPGASKVFKGGVIAYADAVKCNVLGVPRPVLKKHGAVSDETALAMASGARTFFRTTWGVAVTGVAGPGGGSKKKPVGTVWIAIAGPNGRSAELYRFRGSRERIRARAVATAIDLIKNSVMLDF